MNAKNFVTGVINEIGLTVNGSNPEDIKINDERFYRRVLAQGSLGLGESYMEGWWDCDRLDDFLAKLLTANLENKVRLGLRVFWGRSLHYMTNVQTRRQANQLADAHYNISNEMFRHMLGETMAYSCGYWKDANDLDAAQRAKFELICRKLELNDQDHVLDIGCGWGGFARYAAQNFGCRVTGITVANRQAVLAQELCRGDRVTIHCCDYRQILETVPRKRFTKLVSIGMFEHVGYRNYRTFMRIAHESQDDNGLFLLHTIGRPRSTRYPADPWLAKYIFPGSMIPSINQVDRAIEGLYVLEDLQNIGFNYSKTLYAWWQRFEQFWHDPSKHKYRPQHEVPPEQFYRMWRYYLLSASANFRVQRSAVWQFVLSKKGMPGGYIAAR